MGLMTAEDKLTKAKVSLVCSHPFFGTLALRLKLVPKTAEELQQMTACEANPEGHSTAATDGCHIFYNPDWIVTLSVPEVTGLLAHEAMHVGFLHHTRMEGREPDKWNQACDYAINEVIEESKLTLPEGGLLDKQYFGKPAEEIYKLLPTRPPGPKNKGSGFGNILPYPGNKDPNAKAREEADWKVTLSQAAQVAKMAGKLPASIERAVGALMEPKVNWGEQLRQYLTEKIRAEDDWCRPNRRFAHRGMYLPSIRENPTGDLVVAVDTSGSITQKVLDAFESEVRSIATEVQPRKIVVIYCDSGINRVDTFEQDDEVKLRMVGGGGTDFRPPFERVERDGIDPHAFVYLTDGYGPFPDVPAPYPTVWCMTTDVKAPWGHNIQIEIDEY